MAPRRVVSLVSAVVFAAASAALAQDTAPSQDKPPGVPMKASGGDQDFTQKAAVGNLTEVEAGKLAMQNSSNEKVQAFGQRLVADHTKANEELKAAASQEGLSIPELIDAEHQSALDHLKGLSGAEFDTAFKKHMIEDHKEDIALFEKQAASGKSAVDQFAAQSLPTLKQHLKMAENLPASSGAASQH